MGESYMTIADIEKAYPQEWVLVDKLKKGRNGFAVGGVVVAHGTDKEAVLMEMDKLPRPLDVAFYYTGPIPDDVIFLL
jgi:hypothetical protein